jgi:MFS family permease
LSGVLKEKSALGLSNTEVGLASSAYLGGAVLGGLLFGWLTDRLGRKKLFFTTLAVYLAATAATALSWNFSSFALFRAATGAGIGGEGSAIASTIQELVPARMRGWTDLVINGSFWIGAAAGAVASIILLDPAVLPPDWGWRFAFLIGAMLGLVIFLMRMWLPESPRWLMTHGHVDEANRVLDGIEAEFRARGHRFDDEPLTVMRLRTRRFTPLAEVANTLFRVERRRTLVGLTLMAAQAFFYNAIFFTYALVLTTFFNVSTGNVAYFIFPFAIGNVLGPICLGHFFDSVGRRPMITGTYLASALGLLITGWMFQADMLSATTMTICWSITFFFASAGASAAYLTVSEIFPIESRALAIAVFYSIGTLAGGFAAPWLFGTLIGSGDKGQVFIGYVIGAFLMAAGGLSELIWGVEAAGKSLEAVANPLSAVRGKLGEAKPGGGTKAGTAAPVPGR